jgi:hypothetical protein
MLDYFFLPFPLAAEEAPAAFGAATSTLSKAGAGKTAVCPLPEDENHTVVTCFFSSSTAKTTILGLFGIPLTVTTSAISEFVARTLITFSL